MRTKISLFSLIISTTLLVASGCQTDGDFGGHKRHKATRSVPKEAPIKKAHSNLDVDSAGSCIKNNMLAFGIPSKFIDEETLTDRSRIVILKNPESGGEGIYVRVLPDKGAHSTLELYDNNIKYISKSWHALLEKCRK